MRRNRHAGLAKTAEAAGLPTVRLYLQDVDGGPYKCLPLGATDVNRLAIEARRAVLTGRERYIRRAGGVCVELRWQAARSGVAPNGRVGWIRRKLANGEGWPGKVPYAEILEVCPAERVAELEAAATAKSAPA